LRSSFFIHCFLWVFIEAEITIVLKNANKPVSLGRVAVEHDWAQ
jgi:hypothetical protein